jgi:hypothetical protein
LIEYVDYNNIFAEFDRKVMLFNELAGNDIADEKLIPLYSNLLKEELQEIVDAETPEEFLDGVIDSLVVGTYLFKLLDMEFKVFAPQVGNDLGRMAKDTIRFIDLNYIDMVKDYMFEIKESFLGLNVDRVGALNEVMNSNLSKFVYVGDGRMPLTDLEWMDLNKQKRDIEELGRYTGISWERKGGYAVFTDGNGKIMKAKHYWQPKLSQYIY